MQKHIDVYNLLFTTSMSLKYLKDDILNKENENLNSILKDFNKKLKEIIPEDIPHYVNMRDVFSEISNEIYNTSCEDISCLTRLYENLLELFSSARNYVSGHLRNEKESNIYNRSFISQDQNRNIRCFINSIVELERLNELINKDLSVNIFVALIELINEIIEVWESGIKNWSNNYTTIIENKEKSDITLKKLKEFSNISNLASLNSLEDKQKIKKDFSEILKLFLDCYNQILENRVFSLEEEISKIKAGQKKVLGEIEKLN